MKAPATHRLAYYPQLTGLADETSGDSRDLLESNSLAIPFGWLFLFGSRNIWEPGQTVKARGGAAADRNPGIALIDIAQVRLHEAIQTFRADPGLHPVSVALELLERILSGSGKQGQLRLLSPPHAFGKTDSMAERRRQLLEMVALAENVVFHLSQQNRELALRSLKGLEGRCDFVPTGDWERDRKDFLKDVRRIGKNISNAEGAIRLLIGWPVAPAIAQRFATVAPQVMREFTDQVDAARSSKPWWAFWK